MHIIILGQTPFADSMTLGLYSEAMGSIFFALPYNYEMKLIHYLYHFTLHTHFL